MPRTERAHKPSTRNRASDLQCAVLDMPSGLDELRDLERMRASDLIIRHIDPDRSPAHRWRRARMCGPIARSRTAMRRLGDRPATCPPEACDANPVRRRYHAPARGPERRRSQDAARRFEPRRPRVNRHDRQSPQARAPCMRRSRRRSGSMARLAALRSWLAAFWRSSRRVPGPVFPAGAVGGLRA